MPFPFAFAWLNAFQAVRHSHNPIQATVRLEAARMHATHYITLGIREYSPWFPGKDNVIANSLSRDDDRSDDKLTTLFCTHCPSQISNHFDL
jgi:hypothetical protein